MSEKKETKKVITKNELLILNEAWKATKVGKLSNEATKEYLYLKIKVSDYVKKTQEQIADAEKVILSEMGLKEGDPLSREKEIEWRSKINDVVKKITDEKVEIDTHILTFEELCENLINYEPNKEITTEGKATLMKYLLKE